MGLERILTMGPAEIACRGRQEMNKTVERLTTTPRRRQRIPSIFEFLGADGPCGDMQGLYESGEYGKAAEVLLDYFSRHAPGRFFPGACDDAIPDRLSGMNADWHRGIITAADAVCQGKFAILGYGRLSFGDPLDWHYDPVSGRHAPQEHWSKVNPLDDAELGDSKVNWELNRHQWMLELGQAYRITGDEYYARVFAGLVRDWMLKNPPGIGINWSSSLEIAMRLISWCWALFFFRGSKCLSTTLFADMLSWIRIFANYIERYLSYYFSPNTHLTGEALGLYYAGVLFPEIQEASHWSTLGARILETHLEQQVFADGIYFEQSTRYQYYTAEIYLHYLILAETNGMPVNGIVRERLGDMMDFLLAMRRPDGTIPQVGDNDGGWLLPLMRRYPDDYAGLFGIAASVLERRDLAWAAGGKPTPEALWLTGSPAHPDRIWRQAEAPECQSLQIFPEGGYAVMRSSWSDSAHHLVFDTGPLGCTVSGAHGHADLLSVQCTAFGEPYIVDAGTYCYTADRKWRNYFRGTRAHSTVMVDGKDQAETGDVFSWQSPRPEATLNSREITSFSDFVDASHDAYRRLEDPVTHRRRILFVNRRYWVIVDDLVGSVDHRVELGFQFARLALAKEQQWIRACGTRGNSLLVRAFSRESLSTDITSGGFNPMRGWLSQDYGQRIPAPALTYSTDAQLPVRIVTLLLPMEAAATPLPDVNFHCDGDTSTLELGGFTGAHTGEIIQIDSDAMVLSSVQRNPVPAGMNTADKTHVRH